MFTRFVANSEKCRKYGVLGGSAQIITILHRGGHRRGQIWKKLLIVAKNAKYTKAAKNKKCSIYDSTEVPYFESWNQCGLRLRQLLVLFSNFFTVDKSWGNFSDESFGSEQHLSLHSTPRPLCCTWIFHFGLGTNLLKCRKFETHFTATINQQ